MKAVPDTWITRLAALLLLLLPRHAYALKPVFGKLSYAIENRSEFPQYAFYVYSPEIPAEEVGPPGYYWSAEMEPARGAFFPRPTHGAGITPFRLLAVPKSVSDKSRGVPSPRWFRGQEPGVVRVDGELPPVLPGGNPPDTWVLRYRLEGEEERLTLTLLNPETLETLQGRSRGGEAAVGGEVYTAVLVVVAGVVAFLIFRRRATGA